MKRSEVQAESSASQFERELLLSGRADVAPFASRQRMAQSLGIAPPVRTPSGWGSAIGKIGLGVVGLAGLGFTLVTSTADPDAGFEATQEGSVRLLQGRSGEMKLSESLRTEALKPMTQAVSARPTPSRVVAPVASKKRFREPSPKLRTTSRNKVATVVSPRSHLLEEVVALDEVRMFLQASQPRRAQRALVAYTTRYPQGELRLEAELLNVDLALAAGEQLKATELAQALVSKPEAARYRSRLKAILQP